MPAFLGNHMHACAARWMLTHRAQEAEDALIVSLDDGAVGASVLNEGRPNRGCVTAARFPVFADALVRAMRALLLAQIAERVNVDFWGEPAANTAETAGWLALAALFYRGWPRPHSGISAQ